MVDRLPPTPNGYTQASVQIGEVTVFLLSCRTCGALVKFYQTHNEYHKQQAKLFKKHG